MPELIPPDPRVHRSFLAAMAEFQAGGGGGPLDDSETAMLAAALPVARSLGIDQALLTCDEDNLASHRVIEANGGVLADQGGGKVRYWIPTS